jgi:hypothetical protein
MKTCMALGEPAAVAARMDVARTRVGCAGVA